MRKVVIFFVSLFCFFSAFAQEKLGVENSNYSSTNSILLNPSSSVDSRTMVQVNLVGANIYGMTNQVYIPNFSIWSAAKTGVQDPQISKIPFNKFVYLKAEVDGPSVVVSNREIGVGFFVRARAEGNINNIPAGLGNYFVNQSKDTSAKTFDIDLSSTKLSEMTWVEYGLNLGKMFFKHGDVIIAGGANLKYLTGINIAYADFSRLKAHIDPTQVNVQNFKGEMRYNTPGWNTGRGAGADLGITYKKMLKWVDSYYSNSKKSSCKYIDYKYKIGVSLLDVGAIRFVDNTFKEDITGGAVNVTMNDLKKTSNPDSLYNFIKNNFKTSTKTNSPIWASLPTALSVQADWNMSYYLHFKKEHFYINTTLIQGLTTAATVGVQRSNLISIAPRYEIQNIGIAIPLTFQRYLYPQVGFAFRFRTFALGFDNVLPFILKNNTYGMNVYFNLGFSLFKNPACKVSHPRFAPPKIYNGYTFLSLRGKPKKSVSSNGPISKQIAKASAGSRMKVISPEKYEGRGQNRKRHKFKFKNLFRRSKKF
jgi:hypothetical protein